MTGQHYDEYVEFVAPRLPRLRGFAYHLCGDWHRADDLIQTTLTLMFLRWAKVREAVDLDQYVRAILVKAFLSENRRAWSRVRLGHEPADMAAPTTGSPEDRMVLRAALDRLPARQRAALVLRFLCDLSVEETADAMRCSPGTVKSQTFHGLHALRRQLAERLPVSSHRTPADGQEY